MPRKAAVQAPTAFDNPFVDNSLDVEALTRDLADSGRTMSDQEARFLVDYFYISQDNRIRFDGQVRAMGETKEPHRLLAWMGDNASKFEKQIERALAKYTDDHPIGRWIKSLHGFGPILAAGFLAHIDIEKAPTAGHIWSYAGFNPESEWLEGQLRPWNADLKKLCYKAGEVQIKFSGDDKCYYGKIFVERRAFEWDRNFTAYGRDQAIFDQTKKNPYGKTTEAWAWVNGCYRVADIKKRIQAGMSVAAVEIKSLRVEAGVGDPMLPPSQIHARARRYAMKIFLSHLHEVWYETHFKTRVPNPFVIEHMGHVHRIQVPNYDSPYAGDQPARVFRVLKHEGKSQEAFLVDLDGLEVGERILIDRYSQEVQQYFIDGRIASFSLIMVGKKKFAERTDDAKPWVMK